MLTVDTPVVGTKYAAGDQVVWDVVDPELLRVNFDPDYEDAPGSEKALDLGPHDLVWLAEQTGLPVVAKGVLRPDDARRCVQAGAAAVWVSNHGGRQLDRAASTASCLPGGRRGGRGRGPGLRRRRHPQRARRARRPGARRRRGVPGPAAALRARRGRGRRGPDARRPASRRPRRRSGWPAAARSPTPAESPLPPELRRLGACPRTVARSAPRARRPPPSAAARRPRPAGASRESRGGSASGRPQRARPAAADRRGAGADEPGAAHQGAGRPTTARTCPRTSPAPSSTAR